MLIKTDPILSQADRDAIQQPMGNDGWSNDRFNQLYSRNKNPYTDDERDRKNRQGTKMISISAEFWERVFGKK